MSRRRARLPDAASLAVLGVIAVQVLCGLFLALDTITSVLGIHTPSIGWQVIEIVEIGAALGLIAGVVLGVAVLVSAHRRRAAAETRLAAASSAFMDLVEDRFAAWRLTPAERDVALFAVKGLGTAEIARLRATSEGTVKAQTAAIYRKAGVSGRHQLLSLFIEDLIDARPVPPLAAPAAPAPAPAPSDAT